VAGAGNAFQALVWFWTSLTVLFCLVYVGTDDAKSKPLPRYPALWRGYAWFRTGVKAVALAWVGCFWLMAFYMLGVLLHAAARHKSDTLWATTAPREEAGQ
jgi:hypothetical protein